MTDDTKKRFSVFKAVTIPEGDIPFGWLAFTEASRANFFHALSRSLDRSGRCIKKFSQLLHNLELLLITETTRKEYKEDGWGYSYIIKSQGIYYYLRFGYCERSSGHNRLYRIDSPTSFEDIVQSLRMEMCGRRLSRTEVAFPDV